MVNSKGQIYHVEVNVSDFSESVKFYDELMNWLGTKGSITIGLLRAGA